MDEPPPKPVQAHADTSPANPVEAILKVIREGERFLVCSHARPDGDAVGSILAMGMFLRAMGKQADLVSADSIPAVYRSLPEASGIRTALRVHGPYDAAILLECDGIGRTRLRGLDHFFVINIDHHATGRAWATLNWIDRSASSVGELVYRLVKAAGVPVTPELATCIYTTMLTDTGGFCYGSVHGTTFELAKELVEAGANPLGVAQDVYFSTAMSKMLLLGAALRNLHREGRIAWLWVTRNDFARACAAEEDAEGLVNFALSIAGVEAAVFLREIADHRVRISLRSKGRIQVSTVAQRLGGGGHENAAGCTVDGPLERALEQILVELRALVCQKPRTPGSCASASDADREPVSLEPTSGGLARPG